MKKNLLPTEELLRRSRANPNTQARMDEIAECIRSGKKKKGPGVGREELPAFLRYIERRTEEIRSGKALQRSRIISMDELRALAKEPPQGTVVGIQKKSTS